MAPERLITAESRLRQASKQEGADGLRSRIRATLLGPGKPHYAGYTAWRTVVEPREELVRWGRGFESWGRGSRFGCAHIGEGRVYWFATAPGALPPGAAARQRAPPPPSRTLQVGAEAAR